MSKGNSHIDLVRDLEFKLTDFVINANKQQVDLIKIMIGRAKAGAYHDFLSPFATPKMNLRKDLLIANLGDLADKVMEGAYDNESPSDLLTTN